MGKQSSYLPPSRERGQARLREAKGLVHDRARERSHTCVVALLSPECPHTCPCSDQSRQRPCHSRKSLSGRSWGRVGLIHLFSFKKPKGTLDIKEFRNKRSEKCCNMEAGSRSEPSSEAKTPLKPHTAITAGSLAQPCSPSLLTAFVQLRVGHRLCFPAPHKGLPTFSTRWSVPGTPLTYSSGRDRGLPALFRGKIPPEENQPLSSRVAGLLRS